MAESFVVVTDDDIMLIQNTCAKGNVPEKLEDCLVVDERVDKEANNNNSEPLELVKEMHVDDNYFAQIYSFCRRQLPMLVW
jgi:hypothetical protein